MTARVAGVAALLVFAMGCAPERPHGQPAPPVAVSSFVVAGELVLESYGMASDVGDFNGDGVPELAVGHPSAYSLVSMMGARLELLTHGEAPIESYSQVRAADLDRDGHLDLLASDGSGLWLLRNDGEGHLEMDRVLAPGPFPCFSLGDFNADGSPDVLAGGSTVVVLDGQPGAELVKPPRFLAAGQEGVTEVLLTDVTGDDVADLVVADLDSVVTLARGRRSGQFELPEVLGGTIPDSVVAGDIDGDGVDDLLIGNRYMPPLVVFATGAGPRRLYADVLGAGGLVRMADLDLDGATEVFSALSAARRVSGQTGETFERIASVSASGGLVDFQVADFTGDGKVDLAALFLDGDRTRLRLWRGE